MRWPDGTARWLRIANQLFYSDDGRPQRLVGAAIDIQELKQAAELERMAREQAERAARFSEMFVGILGHDLRNPLSAITTGAHVIAARADTERISKPASRIVASADRMGRMINQLLDFTRIRLGHGFPLEATPTDLVQVCRAILDELEPVYSCTVELSAIGDVVGTWDRDRLQLFGNLAANACQHRTPGTTVHVLVDGSRLEAVRLEIRNLGVIPPDLLPMI